MIFAFLSFFFLYLFCAIALLFAALFLVFVICQIIADFTTDAPYVPVPQGAEQTIIANLNLTPGSVLYDLGCGDARVLLLAVAAHPDIQAVGVEKSFFPYLLAKWRTRKFPQITVRREDIFTTDVSRATHVFLYLFPQVIDKLFPILRTQCKPGTRVLSCDFQLSHVSPYETITLSPGSELRGKKLFVYKI